jgi:chaperonin GroES
MASIRPLGNRILIKRAKAETKKGGILLPDTAQEKPKEGIVVEVGPGKYDDSGKLEPMHVKKGDRVLFSNYAGTEIKINDEDEIILSEDDVLGILN